MSVVVSRGKVCPRCQGRFELDAAFCPKDGARLEDPNTVPPEDPYLGTVIAGDLELRSVAGVGAMGRVYRAHQRGIDRDVAVKILHRELSSNAQLVARFHREAKIASKLQHPHVVEVYFVGQLPDGSLYMVMEYLDGMSLADALANAKDGRLSLDRTVSIGLQICDAVGEGHARGIVHRDLKPENVMLIRRAEVREWAKVLDFGIAKLTLGEQSMETAVGLIFGTARYISPEGAQGRGVGPPGDVYAIATILYQLLAGRTPFDAEPIGLLIKHIHEVPPDLRSVLPKGVDVPLPLARVVMDNLAKDPERRAESGRALAMALIAAMKEAQIPFSDVGVVARMSQLPAPTATSAPSLVSVIEPTIDDFSIPRIATPEAVLPVSPALVPAPPSEPKAADERASAPQAAPTSRSSWPSIVLAVLVAFGLGGAAATALFRQRTDDAELARREWVLRTRAALSDGHYVAPPGENVKDLVAVGLERWPQDVELRQLRSAAEKEMITMAITARESGDLVGARNLSRDALQLDATDNSARYMRAQTEEELDLAIGPNGPRSGPPRLVFEAPPVVKPGDKVTFRAKIVWGAIPPNTKVTGVKVSVLPNGKTVGAVPVVLASTAPEAMRVELVAPTVVGSYDISFEANVAGTVVRAMRDLDVAP